MSAPAGLAKSMKLLSLKTFLQLVLYILNLYFNPFSYRQVRVHKCEQVTIHLSWRQIDKDECIAPHPFTLRAKACPMACQSEYGYILMSMPCLGKRLTKLSVFALTIRITLQLFLKYYYNMVAYTIRLSYYFMLLVQHRCWYMYQSNPWTLRVRGDCFLHYVAGKKFPTHYEQFQWVFHLQRYHREHNAAHF